MSRDPSTNPSLDPTYDAALEVLRRGQPVPGTGLRDRIRASRAAGVRDVPALMAASGEGVGDLLSDESELPDAEVVSLRAVASESIVSRVHRWPRWLGLAAAASAVLYAIVRVPAPVEAGVVSGALHLSSALPKSGETVTVRYTSGGLLGRPTALRLRARIRMPGAEAYETNVPVVTLAMLRRVDGATYEGRFKLADSVVFAALAVEDTSGQVVDDFGGRAWEVVRAGADGKPTLPALTQRTSDMMGRSWEEGLVAVREMVRLYPDSLSSWRWLGMYESWMSLETDSTKSVQLKKLAHFDALYRHQRQLPVELLGDMYWYSRGDSTYGEYWRERLLRDAPHSESAVAERMLMVIRRFWQKPDTAGALAELEALWPSVPSRRQAQVAGEALDLLPKTEAATPMFRRWSQRVRQARLSVGYQQALAVRALALPEMHDEALLALRQLVGRQYADSALTRWLWEDRAAYLRRATAAKRSPLLALGKALAADGHAVAARDTLGLAAAAGWNTTAFSEYAKMLWQFGDSAGARRQWARVVVDPLVQPATRDSLTRRMQREVGDSIWRILKAQARDTLGAMVMRDAQRRRIDDVNLSTLDGKIMPLASQGGETGTVVIFWSKDCGPAVEALPELQKASERFGALGFRTISVAEQPQRDSTLDRIIRANGITMPVFLDRGGAASKAFNNWGTPQIYLLDSHGRLVFRATSDINRAILQAHAMTSVP
jgi:peroxiredoxin